MKGKRIEYFADINSVPKDPLPEDGPKLVNNLVVDSLTEEKPSEEIQIINSPLIPNTGIQNENLSMCMRDCLSIMNTNTLINIGLLAVIFILIIIINKITKK
jgi:hypothetical protein